MREGCHRKGRSAYYVCSLVVCTRALPGVHRPVGAGHDPDRPNAREPQGGRGICCAVSSHTSSHQLSSLQCGVVDIRVTPPTMASFVYVLQVECNLSFVALPAPTYLCPCLELRETLTRPVLDEDAIRGVPSEHTGLGSLCAHGKSALQASASLRVLGRTYSYGATLHIRRDTMRHDL
ncbi:hypothetical protein K466DRAFT_182128 [Polyporus arcularius HHB13444]|uniref:Uncharacterized protein n=1 Tax=Polyporus arcularius HHB13444 TaxID=1314778 RepID=A0A5C3PXT7_9APHY|nr:hypothetical protein K466DRAFT_182128 [Polyporus arcularius HHB13444]